MCKIVHQIAIYWMKESKLKNYIWCTYKEDCIEDDQDALGHTFTTHGCGESRPWKIRNYFGQCEKNIL